MSGLCGYVGVGPHENSLQQMLLLLTRFDDAPGATLSGDAGALAIAASAGSAHLHREAGLLVAIWGRPTLRGRSAGVAAPFLRIWRDCGPQACAQLNGAFALCLIDSRSDEALLAVDRAGIHCLTYQRSGTGLIFASSADALLAHPLASGELDHQSLYHYLHFHVVPSPRSVYRGQQRLQPGEYLHLRAGKATRGAYWKLQFDESDAQPYEQLRSRFLGLLGDSVRSTLDSPRLGAFLSGGTDSSTLTGFLGQVSCAPAQTYSIGFDAPGYDETKYARIAAQHFGSAHHEMYVTADHVVAAVPRLAQAFDQPFGNASALPAYYCARMAREDGVTRLLGGDGGDELFGGNERYAQQAVFGRYEVLPSALRQLAIEPVLFGLAAKQEYALFRKARSYVRQALSSMPGRLDTYNLLQHYGPQHVLEPEFLAQVDLGVPADHLGRLYWRSNGTSQINRMQALDLQLTLADNDLRKVGSACELAGVEVAYPFLCDTLIEFSASLAPHHKLQGTQLRPFFKRALSSRLPRAILRKKKHGFGLPFGHWLQNHAGLRELAGDSLQSLKRRRIVQAQFIDALFDQHLKEHPSYHGTMVWVMMMLEQWHQARGR
jgi:asparagine synthase (glutamine-hydrolysing)